MNLYQSIQELLSELDVMNYLSGLNKKQIANDHLHIYNLLKKRFLIDLSYNIPLNGARELYLEITKTFPNIVPKQNKKPSNNNN